MVLLDWCWWRDHLINKVGQRLCLYPLSDELCAIVQNIEVYERLVNEVGEGTD